MALSGHSSPRTATRPGTCLSPAFAGRCRGGASAPGAGRTPGRRGPAPRGARAVCAWISSPPFLLLSQRPAFSRYPRWPGPLRATRFLHTLRRPGRLRASPRCPRRGRKRGASSGPGCAPRGDTRSEPSFSKSRTGATSRGASGPLPQGTGHQREAPAEMNGDPIRFRSETLAGGRGPGHRCPPRMTSRRRGLSPGPGGAGGPSQVHSELPGSGRSPASGPVIQGPQEG